MREGIESEYKDFLSQIFIATPTHICKRYAAKQFSDAICLYTGNARSMVVCNSKADAAPYYAGCRKMQYTRLDVSKSEYNNRIDSIHRRITDSANMLRDYFLKHTMCEWYLSLESDVILIPTTMEKIFKRVSTGNFSQEGSLIKVLHTNCYQYFNDANEFGKTNRITMGCTLIHRSVLDHIKFRYDIQRLNGHYDAFFASDCSSNFIDMFYDPDIHVHHIKNAYGFGGWQELPASEKMTVDAPRDGIGGPYGFL